MTTSDTVESLGSVIPRILRAYGEDCFKFTDNFIRITLPISAHELLMIVLMKAPSRHLVDIRVYKLVHKLCIS